MGYKMAPSLSKTVQQMTDERAAAKSDKATEDERASMRLFGFSDAEAMISISRFVTTSSPDPVSDMWDHMPSGVWYKAHELVSTLDADNVDDIVNEALQAAKSPKDFWKRLQSSLTEGEVDNE